MDWLSFWIGVLAGIFCLITLASYGIIKANRRLGIDLVGLSQQWYTNRRNMKQNGNLTRLETEVPGIPRETTRESGISEVCGTTDASDKKESISGREKETSNN